MKVWNFYYHHCLSSKGYNWITFYRMAVCHATTTIISYPLMVKKFTITVHKVYEAVAICTTAHKYIIFFMLYIIVMVSKTLSSGLLSTTFVR